jgi:hypothetical protein
MLNLTLAPSGLKPSSCASCSPVTFVKSQNNDSYTQNTCDNVIVNYVLNYTVPLPFNIYSVTPTPALPVPSISVIASIELAFPVVRVLQFAQVEVRV